MEVLFEYRGSRRTLELAEKKTITRIVGDELHRVGRSRAQVFTASDDLPSSGVDIYLLQRWSNQWGCYVDVGHYNELVDGDKLAVIAKPKPRSWVFLLCCCGSDSSYRSGKVGGSKVKIPKTEEIQSLEYKFRAESEAGSILEETSAALEDNAVTAEAVAGEQYVRAESGRAAWKLVEKTSSAPAEESESRQSPEQELEESNGREQEESVEQELGESGVRETVVMQDVEDAGDGGSDGVEQGERDEEVRDEEAGDQVEQDVEQEGEGGVESTEQVQDGNDETTDGGIQDERLESSEPDIPAPTSISHDAPTEDNASPDDPTEDTPLSPDSKADNVSSSDPTNTLDSHPEAENTSAID